VLAAGKLAADAMIGLLGQVLGRDGGR